MTNTSFDDEGTSRNKGIVIAIAALILVGLVATLVIRSIGGGSDDSVVTAAGGTDASELAFAEINCLGGSEKRGFMGDPEVQRILRDDFNLVVNFQPRGSIEQVQMTKAQLEALDVDCLWPSSVAAQNVFEAERNVAIEFPGYRATTVFNSPEVIYTGSETFEVLEAEGLVTVRDGGNFLDIKRLIDDYVLAGVRWEDLGATIIRGPVQLESTNPTQSNSGFTAFLLMLNMIGADDPFGTVTAEQATAAMSTLRSLYEQQGLQSSSSGFAFQSWLSQGNELSAPLLAGYESQLVEIVATESPATAQAILDQVVMLYPDPTIFNGHPVLSFNSDAARFAKALDGWVDEDGTVDNRLAEIAWERYGLRPNDIAGADTSLFPDVQLSDRLRTTNLPQGSVIVDMLNCLETGVCRR